MYNECRVCGEVGRQARLPEAYVVTLCEECLNAYTEYILDRPESLELARARKDKDLESQFILRRWWYYTSKNWVQERNLEFREQKCAKLERAAGINRD